MLEIRTTLCRSFLTSDFFICLTCRWCSDILITLAHLVNQPMGIFYVKNGIDIYSDFIVSRTCFATSNILAMLFPSGVAYDSKNNKFGTF